MQLLNPVASKKSRTFTPRVKTRMKKFMLPKRRFWKAEPTFPNVCSKHFSTIRSPNRVLMPLKELRKHIRKGWFGLPKSSFGRGKVDKKIDNNKSKDLGRKTHAKVMKMTSRVELCALKSPNTCFCCYRYFLSTFSYVFCPRRESATFLLATMLLNRAFRLA